MTTDIYARNEDEGLTFGPHGFFPYGTMKRSDRRRLNELTKQLDQLQEGDDEDRFDAEAVPLICQLIETMLDGGKEAGLARKLHEDYMADAIGLHQLQRAQELIMQAVSAQSQVGNA